MRQDFSTRLLYIEDKNFHKNFIFVIDNLFDAHINI